MKLLAILLFSLASVGAVTYTKCSLASKLVRLGVSRSDVYKWVCMAQYESSFRTTATNTNSDKYRSTDYGIFQINSYWNCHPRDGRATKNGCGRNCSDYMNSDLSDDIRCIYQLLREHRNKGGFSSFSYGYRDNCESKTSSYLSGCNY